MSEWWTVQDAGLIGGLGGTALGVFGGLLGAGVGVLAPRGVARAPVVGVQAALACIGLVTLLAGVYASAVGQPYHVRYPLILAGCILTCVLGALLPVTLWAYRVGAWRRERSRREPSEGAGAIPELAPGPAGLDPAYLQLINEAWGPAGSLRSMYTMLALALGVGAAGFAVPLVLALAGSADLQGWLPWLMATGTFALTAVLTGAMPRLLAAQARTAQALLERQRLAAEELRRG